MGCRKIARNLILQKAHPNEVFNPRFLYFYAKKHQNLKKVENLMIFMKVFCVLENKYKIRIRIFKLDTFKKIETFLLGKVYNTSL